ncbi:hypothetical protein LOC54_12000 [Acetobacter sp. AN02]|uniref:hypothetical protein n=1 Tax=Acetobacter sp. AN02 TaxID=2894186 RepID=UPI0024344739|nr:hypothetical protein [Acetobacter sp. AN02]MDG6095788.1 hypothetical protein [Acetobacter sp. AN02]
MSSANGYLTNTFNSQKLSNQAQIQQMGGQLVGEVGGQLPDALDAAGVPGFAGSEVSGALGRIALETAGNAAVAAISGGNVGAVAAGTAAGDVAAIGTRQWVKGLAGSLTDGPQAQRAIANLLSNAIASGAGAVAGALTGGPGSTAVNALNGAGYASAIQQYNQDAEDAKEPAGIAVTGVSKSDGYEPAPGPDPYAVDPGTEPAVPGLTAAGQKDGNGNFVYRVSGTDTLVAIDGNGNQTAPYTNRFLIRLTGYPLG